MFGVKLPPFRRYLLLLLSTVLISGLISTMSGCSTIDKLEKTKQSMDTVQEASRQFSIESYADGAVPNDTAAKVWINRAIALMPHSNVPYDGPQGTLDGDSDDEPGIIDTLEAWGRYPLLITLLKKAVTDPKLASDSKILLTLADAEERMGQTGDATKTYASAIVAINKSLGSAGTTFDPNNSILLDRARAEYYGGQRAKGIADFQEIIAADNDQSSVAENDLAYFYSLDKTDLPDAKKLAIAALANARKQGNDQVIGIYEDTLAWTDHQMGDNQDALFYEQEAASLTPLIGDLQYHLGQICQDNGQTFQARVAYTRAIKLDPFFPESRAALQSLPPAKAASNNAADS
jgi:tetratricopeptide (TPR) repeat protein